MGLASAELGGGLAIVNALPWKARNTGKQETKIYLKSKRMILPSDKYTDTVTAEGWAFPSYFSYLLADCYFQPLL